MISFKAEGRKVRLSMRLPGLPILDDVYSPRKLRGVRSLFVKLGRKLDRALAAAAAPRPRRR